MLELLRADKKALIPAQYVLFDSWFSSPNIFNGLPSSVPPQPFCQKCDGIMTPVSYTGIQGITYEYKVKTVSDLLGHANTQITWNTYVHSTNDSTREAANTMDNIYKNMLL